MKRHIQKLTHWIFTIFSVFFVLLGVASTSHAALYTVNETVTSSLGDGFQIPTFGTVLNCDGDCGLGGDAVIVSFYFRDVAPQYDQAILQVRTSSGFLQRPLGAGYMAGTDISPTNVNILDESNLLGGAFDFFSPFLNPGDATNSLLLTFQAGSLLGCDLQWGYRKTEDNSIGLATFPLTELQAVPIPSAIWLFGSVLIGFVGIKRKLSK